MSMDAAISRFPRCPWCHGGVEENAPEEPCEMLREEWWHSRCVVEARHDLFFQRSVLKSVAVTTNPRVA